MRTPRMSCSAVVVCALGASFAPARATSAPPCRPTPPDALGPFYRPGAPVRSVVGKGHVLRGTVRSSADCRPIPGSRVELWLAGPNGYDDDHRATVIADEGGRYFFESEPPGPYESRPPHIHLRVEHPGYATLVTQQYPAPGRAEETFDLVLVPAR